MYKKVFLLALFFFIGFSIFGQTAISGTVVDEAGSPLLGATVLLQNSVIGAVTGADGSFKISRAPIGDHLLECTSLGYTTKVVPVTVQEGNEVRLSIRLLRSAEELDEMVVVGTSKAEQLKEQGFSVAVLETATVKNTNLDINQLLKTVSGVNIRESGGLGSGFDLSLNGLSGNQIRYFIDGVPMERFGSSLTLNNFPPNLVERIEVFKGVVPTTLGADALGGAINITTAYRGKSFLDVSYAYGSFNTHIASVNGQYADKGKGHFFKVSSFYNHSDNDYLMRDVPVFDLELGNNLGTIDIDRFHDDYSSAMVTLEAGVFDKKWADGASIMLTGALNRKNYQHPDNNILRVFGGFRTEGESYLGRINYSKTFHKLHIKAYALLGKVRESVIDTSAFKYNWAGDFIKRDDDDPKGELLERRSFLKLDDIVANSQLTMGYRFNDYGSLGLTLNQNRLKRTGDDIVDPLNRVFEAPNTINKNVVGLSYTYKNIVKGIEITPFLKGYRFKGSITSEGIDGTLTTSAPRFEDVGYGAAIAYARSPKLSFKTSYELAYRIPEAFEILGDGIYITPNPGLGPEQSDNFNFGIRYDTKNNNFGLDAETNLFYRNSKNFIRFNPLGPFGEFENLNNVRSVGAEAALLLRYRRLLRLSTNLTYQEITDQTAFDEGLPNINFKSKVPNIPYLFGNAQLGIVPFKPNEKNELSLFWNLRFVQEFFLIWENLGDPNQKNVIPKQFIQDFRVQYTMKEGKYNLALAVNNVFDQLAFDNFSIQRPGRSFNIKLSYFIH